jgi:hypothetical protein
MSAAGAPLQAAVGARLRSLGGFAVYDGPPVQATAPYALVEAGPESDWSHKSGAGRELRLAVTLHDRGEKPARLRALMAAVEESLGGGAVEIEGWQLVSLHFVRSRVVPPAAGAPNGLWAAVIEFRARLLAE